MNLEILKNAYTSIPREMGITLQRTAYSPNIKERMDASCAIFDAQCRMLAQVEHIPVHLGAMPLTMRCLQDYLNQELNEGDQILLNDPYYGSTHLPDLTLVRPVFLDDKLMGYAVNRAHHSDIGGLSPGSMPGFSTEIYQEGLIIPPCRLVENGKENMDIFRMIEANTRTPKERIGDLRAQIAANNTGARRFKELISKYSMSMYEDYTKSIIGYSERMMKLSISTIPEGSYTAEDFLDDDGQSARPVRIKTEVTVSKDQIHVDFEGTDKQRPGNINAPLAVTISSVYYVIRCINNPDIPLNHGCYVPISICVPEGTILNPEKPHAVSAGNVETAQRIVDVLLLAFSKALPEKIPAQSQGTMNNTILGGMDDQGKRFAYYETIAGGAGALPFKNGASGVQVHMTNTANTPIEAIESVYPIRIEAYELSDESGGRGKFKGGMGVKRSIRILSSEATLSIQSERRKFAPRGLAGGEPGRKGRNYLIRKGRTIELGSKVTTGLERDDIVVIESPGGGGYGEIE